MIYPRKQSMIVAALAILLVSCSGTAISPAGAPAGSTISALNSTSFQPSSSPSPLPATATRPSATATASPSPAPPTASPSPALPTASPSPAPPTAAPFPTPLVVANRLWYYGATLRRAGNVVWDDKRTGNSVARLHRTCSRSSDRFFQPLWETQMGMGRRRCCGWLSACADKYALERSIGSNWGRRGLMARIVRRVSPCNPKKANSRFRASGCARS